MLSLPLKVPLLGGVACSARPHPGVGAALWRAVGRDAHVGLRVVDGFVLNGTRKRRMCVECHVVSAQRCK